MIKLYFKLSSFGYEEINVSLTSLFDDDVIDAIIKMEEALDKIKVVHSLAGVTIYGDLGSKSYSGFIEFEAFNKKHHISFIKIDGDVIHSAIVRGDNPLDTVDLLKDTHSVKTLNPGSGK